MALVNNKHNFIFFHLYKCGGMSFRKLLNDHAKGSKELLGGHVLPKELQKHFNARGKQERFNEMFKFTIVRNPFDFLLSTYHYARTYTNHFMHKDVLDMEFSAFPDYYMEWIDKHKKENIHGKNKVTTIYDFLHDDEGNLLINFIARLENIQQDTKIILKEIGVPNAPLPRINVNKNNDKKYQKVIDAKTREAIEKHFAKDLEFLNYEF